MPRVASRRAISRRSGGQPNGSPFAAISASRARGERPAELAHRQRTLLHASTAEVERVRPAGIEMAEHAGQRPRSAAREEARPGKRTRQAARGLAAARRGRRTVGAAARGDEGSLPDVRLDEPALGEHLVRRGDRLPPEPERGGGLARRRQLASGEEPSRLDQPGEVVGELPCERHLARPVGSERDLEHDRSLEEPNWPRKGLYEANWRGEQEAKLAPRRARRRLFAHHDAARQDG